MPLSYNQYVGDGSTRAFNLDFDYIDKSHVQVRVDGSNVPFTWLNTYQVQTVTAPAAGAIIDVRRVTPRDEILVEFMDGSVLVETDLNLATIQSFFLAQEAFDQGEASMAVTPDGHYSAGLRRITMVLDPVDDRDVVTKQWALNHTNTNVAAAVAAKNAAESARDNAISAKNDANSAASTANNHKSGAEFARNAAENAQSAAEDARDDAIAAKNAAQSAASSASSERAAAQTARSGAETAQSLAQSAKTAAEAARNSAQDWADKAVDSPISSGVYSARHWAAKALEAAQSLLGDIATLIHGATTKATPVDADEVALVDSAASWGLKRLTWANIKAGLKTYFDTLYVKVGGSTGLGG